MPQSAARVTDDPLESEWFAEDGVLGLNPRAARSVAAAAAQAVGLKTFPAVAQHVLGLVSDPDVAIGDLRGAIEQDAALAGRLLRVANCSAYTRTSRCKSIDDAVLRLGTNRVKNLVAGIAAFGMFPAESAFATEVRAHSAGVAAVVAQLGRHWRDGYSGDLFLLGLLHDLGKLASLQVGDLPYPELTDEERAQPDRVHRWEQERVGYDHAALGATVLHGWRFDHALIEAVAWHHEPGRAMQAPGDVGLAVALLRLADGIDYALRDGPTPDREVIGALARSGAADYAGFDAPTLESLWTELADVHHEVQSALIE